MIRFTLNERVMKYLSLLNLSPPLLLISAQLLFVSVGILFLHFSISWLQVFTILTVAVGTEYIGSRLTGQPFRAPYSAIAAALGIAIFLRADGIIYFALAAFIAIASKYIVRTNTGHIFNPSNFAILSTVVLFNPAATIEFTQWGDSLAVYTVIATIALLIAYRAGVIVTTLSFLSAYTVLLFLLAPYAPDSIAAHHYGLLGPSLVLFASFMITDPKTSPQAFGPRILHGIGVALLYFAFELSGLRYSLFLAAFVVTILNLASRYLTTYIPLFIRRIDLVNGYAFAAICLFAVYSFIPVYENSEKNFPIASLSPQFVFAGIEGGRFLQCSRSAVFTDATDESGLMHVNGYTSGVSWGDVDNDGDDDLLIASLSHPVSIYENVAGTLTPFAELYQLPEQYPAAGYFVDYDNDGDLDVFLAGPLTQRKSIPSSLTEQIAEFARQDTTPAVSVFRNDDGTFVEVTDTLGLADVYTHQSENTAMTFGDLDNDGDLDLVLAHDDQTQLIVYENATTPLAKTLFDPFFDYTYTVSCDPDEVSASLAHLIEEKKLNQDERDRLLESGACIQRYDTISHARTYTLEVPLMYQKPAFMLIMIPGVVQLFEYDSGRYIEQNRLSDVTAPRLPSSATALQAHDEHYMNISGRYFQPVAFDFDNDGDLDIFLAIDIGANALLQNNGSFAFTDVTEAQGMAHSGSGMGVAVADYDNNGSLDVAITNVREDYVYLNSGTEFKKQDTNLGYLGVGWGIVALDYNLDGWDDLFIANGDIERTANVRYEEIGKSLFRADLLARNTHGSFTNTTWTDMCPDTDSSLGLATADIDNDGDPDVLSTGVQMSPHRQSRSTLYRNDIQGRNYIGVKLRGSTSNSFGVGAKIFVTKSDGTTQLKQVSVGESFRSQNSYTQLFGLGTSSDPVDIRVEWPSSIVDEHTDVSVNRTMILSES